MATDTLKALLPRFAIYGELEDIAPYGKGHINLTFVSRWNQAGTHTRYIHQRVNSAVFPHPEEVMDNILRVTSHIAGLLRAEGRPGWTSRVLIVAPARDGLPFVRDRDGAIWRTYLFIEGAVSRETPSNPDEAAFLGRAVGVFQKQLSSLGGPPLRETIPHFHDARRRYSRFREAAASSPPDRLREAGEDIAFIEENEERGTVLTRLLETGALPLRVCHNDAKMDNILIHPGGKDFCIADLDTVMPGTPLFDFGDMVRSAANPAPEDERDLSKVIFDAPCYRALLGGYLDGAGEFLTGTERSLLPEAGRAVTLIQALRFLTDYLEGDHYYPIAYPAHNLDRCRCQLALVQSMDSQWDKISSLV